MNEHITNFEQEEKEQEISVGFNTINDLRIAGQWGMMLAVMGFISIGIMLLFALLFTLFPFGNQFDAALPYPRFLLGGLYLIFAVIYLFPVIYLYKFSTHAKKTFLHRDETEFNYSIRNLKILFRLTGIFTIAMLVISFLGIMFAVVISVFAF